MRGPRRKIAKRDHCTAAIPVCKIGREQGLECASGVIRYEQGYELEGCCTGIGHLEIHPPA